MAAIEHPISIVPLSSRIRLGVLTRTHGLDGTLRCTLDHEVVPRVVTPCPAWVGYSDSFTEEVLLLECKERSGDLLFRFQGIDTMERAQALLDRAVFLEEESVQYDSLLSNPGLIGYEVQDEKGTRLGQITNLFRTSAHYIWTIERGETEWMIPAIDEFIVEVRHTERTVTVRTIPGLIDEEPGHANG